MADNAAIVVFPKLFEFPLAVILAPDVTLPENAPLPVTLIPVLRVSNFAELA